MPTLLTPLQTVIYLLVFALVMLFVTTFFGRKIGSKTVEGFLVVDRNVHWTLGGFSIAASWTWAVALMISVQMAYQQGLAGIFWFTVPNVIAVLVFIWLGPRIRDLLPKGYSLPEYMHSRFHSRGVTYLYLFVYFYYQVIAATVQIYAGAQLLSAASGISATTLMPTVLIITLLYAVISGLEASIVTDFLQLVLILVPGWITIFLVTKAGGFHFNLHGVGPGGGLNPFSPSIALTAGVISSIGLLSGSIGDQVFWQRCLAIRAHEIRRSFLFGALLFATIPIGLSLLGFTAAAPEVGFRLPHGFDPSLVGFAVVHQLIPAGLATMYMIMILSGLCSTLDSSLSAASSLYELVVTKPWSQDAAQRRPFTILQGRLSMLVVGMVGLVLGYAVEFIPGFGLKYLWWFLNTIGACVVVPTVLSLFWNRLQAKGILIGSGIGLAVGLPLVSIGSIKGNDPLLAATYAGIVLVSVMACLFTAAPATHGGARRDAT